MNRKKKAKAKQSVTKRARSTPRRSHASIPTVPSGWTDENIYPEQRSRGEFSAGELGQPDSDDRPDKNNPLGVQGGRGPLNEEGEGDRQNDQLAELESDVDAQKDLEERR